MQRCARMVLPHLPQKPVYRRLAHNIDFFNLFVLIERDFENCFLLESLGEENYDSRYSAIGFGPKHLLRGIEHSLQIDDAVYPGVNPYREMAHRFPQGVISRNYAGGLVGYLGYDSANYFEERLNLSWHSNFPAFIFGLYTDGLVFDKFTGELYYFFYEHDRSPLIEKWLTLLQQKIPTLRAQVTFTGFSKSREQHREMVTAAKEEILAGNTFQVQIGLSGNYQVQGNLLAVYRELRSINPSPYMFYLKFGERVIAGASPELVFRLRQGEMETYPLAGTTRRGATESEDRELVRQLLADPKEIAEHNMLIDLHRNDIGRVARFGTVKVRRFFDIKRFSHVQHISSEVAGIMDSRNNMFSALASVFPAGTLSGAPKIESMKIIERIEREPRGPYGGAVGHFGFNGDCTFAIPIRSFFAHGSQVYTRASGGIVYDSVAENEYLEIENKLAAVRRAFQVFEEQP